MDLMDFRESRLGLSTQLVTILLIKPADANSVTTYFGTPANAGLQFSEASDSVLRSYNSSHRAGAEVALVFSAAVPIYAIMVLDVGIIIKFINIASLANNLHF